MTALVKKIHMYTGLLSFVTLVVFGIAGLTATFQPSPERRRPEPAVTFRPFTVAPNLSDKEAADQVYAALRIPLSNPIPKYAVRRNSENQLALDFYTVNGIHRVTVLETENQLRIAQVRNSVWQYLNNAHTITPRGNSQHMRVRMWSWYNELAIWSLLFMSISGVWLWLASRPRFRWAQLSFAAGSGLFIALYALTR
jgi:hypothetical protein